MPSAIKIGRAAERDPATPWVTETSNVAQNRTFSCPTFPKQDCRLSCCCRKLQMQVKCSKIGIQDNIQHNQSVPYDVFRANRRTISAISCCPLSISPVNINPRGLSSMRQITLVP